MLGEVLNMRLFMKSLTASEKLMVCRAVCARTWACAELTEQLRGRLQVKDEASPPPGRTSIIDGLTQLSRATGKGETEREPGESRQQTRSYAAEC